MARDGGERKGNYCTDFPGLSRRPPRLVWSWQQQRIYRIRPSRLYRLSSAGGRVLVVVVDVAPAGSPAAAAAPRPPLLSLLLLLLLLRHASIRGKHPPTQWL